MKKILLVVCVLATLLLSFAAVFAQDLYTLRMVYWPGPESDAMEKVLPYFNETYGKDLGFKVEMELFGRDQVFLKQEALMAAQSPDVDLFYTASRWLGKYGMFMEPLDDYLADPEINTFGGSTDGWIKATIDGMRFTENKLYGVPLDLSAHFLYYRADLIDQLLSDEAWKETYRALSKEHLGVEMEPKDPNEWTWDDYLAASFFFTKQYNPDSPTEYGNFTHGKVMGPTAFLWTNCYWGFGGDWFDAEGKVSFDNEAAVKALEIWKTSFGKGLTPPSSVTGEFSEDNEALRAGQVALTVHWNAAYPMVNGEDSPMAGKYKVVAPPAGPEGRFAYNHTLGVGINKFSEHREEAARWISWLFTEEFAKLYAEAGGIPPYTSVLASMSDARPDFGDMVEIVEKYGRNLPATAGIIEDMACQDLSNAWTDAAPIEESLKNLQKNSEDELANW